MVNQPINDISISVLIPLLNEEKNIPELYERLKKVLLSFNDHEIIFIDDGSTDTTFKVLRELNEKDSSIKIIRFRRNFGQTAALSAGFDQALGDVIITIDGDLQNEPEDIPRLLEKMNDGYDIVCGWRADRNDPFLSKKIPSRISNWLAFRLTGINIHDNGCTLKAFKSDVIKNIRLYGELHRYIPAVASWMGISITEIPVQHHSRVHGASKYTVSRLFRGLLDLITVKFLISYSTRPMQLFGIPGALSSFVGLSIGAYLAFIRIFYHISIGDRPMLMLAILLIIMGIQFISMGLLGEIIVRTYYEGLNKPIYAIKETIGI
jgi:glycosyltransferase involved in cell wall biosynthesis